jgi:sugar lactone lactonase YvrE
MPPANFVAVDAAGRIWLTVSTRLTPRARDYRPDASTGFVAVCEAGRTEIAADGLGYTNECLFSSDGGTLWVVETFGRRLSAFSVEDGRLSRRRTVARFGPGDFPDGLAETADGSLLVASIVSDRLLRVRPDGTVERLMQDADADHLADVEQAYRTGMMGRPHLDTIGSARLGHISSVAFGGADLTTLFLGSLLGDGIGVLHSDLAGRPLPHWRADLGPLAEHLEATA